MKNLFEGLANQNNAVVTSTLKNDTSSLAASGSLVITKGIISVEISYWCNVWKHKIDGYIKCDDWDWNIENTFISGVKVDSITKFNEGLTNMGLSTISKSLELTLDEIREEMFKAIDGSASLKGVFPGKKLFNALSREEKRKIILDDAIFNYDKANAWELNNLGLSESPNTLPSLEQLIELKNNLK